MARAVAVVLREHDLTGHKVLEHADDRDHGLDLRLCVFVVALDLLLVVAI
ncbi:MAG: hypothetical protein V2I33_21310 [Kangiellaceae bacterium]|nr:hypothetical protein [Kangiellaceae bacterium]